MANQPSHRHHGPRYVNPDGSFTRGFDAWLEGIRAFLSSTTTVPVGTLRAYLGTGTPDGYLKLDGSAVSKAKYSELFAVIGGGYGETATTFTLPNMTGATLIGAGSIALGALGGSNSVTLTVAQLPSHGHTFTGIPHGHTVTDPGHTHGITDPGHTHTDETTGSETVMMGAGAIVADYNVAGVTSSATTGVTVDSATTGLTVDDATATGTIGATGSGDPIDTTPRALAVSWLIKY